jgi:TatD DNase family protein
MLGIPDCHAHLDQFGEKVLELLQEWEAAGVAPVVSAGMDIASSQEAIELGWRLRTIKAAVGLHPWKIAEAYQGNGDLEAYGDVASDTMVVAVSEVGLDNVNIETPLETQREVLTWFIGLAQDRGFPVILHLQAPVEQLLGVWEKIEGRRPAGAIHSFSGSQADAEALLDRGFYLSFGPVSLGLIGDKPVSDEVVRLIPDEKLLVDSDAFPSFEQWPEVHPAVVADVARRIAEVRRADFKQLKRQLGNNFTQLLNNQW